jgi:formylglycine-generating enzyme required for sulfatase activity/serine/threonine protein kinase
VDEKIDRYELKSQLGRGGMATVYHAYDPRFQRYVAVKVLPREFLHDETFISRFEREALTIANLEHLAIVPVHDFGEYEGQPYLVMRYMPGGSLRDRIKRGPMALADIRRIVDQLAPALDKAHAQGVIHRDLKPGNILFDEDDNAYLSDFGIAKISEATAQLTGSGIVGTPAYMAPEIADTKELTSAVDIYALGVIVYQMLTGKQPFQAATPMGILLAHINQPVPDVRQARPDLPEAMQYILARALAKNPADRYPCAADLAADLNHVVRMQGDESTTTLPSFEAPPPEPVIPSPEALTMDGVEAAPLPKPAKRARGQPIMLLPWIILGAAVILLGVGGLALAGVFGGNQPATPEAEIAQEESETGSLAEPTDAPLPATFTPEPTDPPPPTSTPEPTLNPIYVLAKTGVSSNNEWESYIQEFNGVPMALVPAGCFMMGSTEDEFDYAMGLCEERLGEGECAPTRFDNELPQYEICIEEPFWFDVYEVTNAQFAAFLNQAGNQTEGDVTWLKATADDVLIEQRGETWAALDGYQDHPAIELRWFGAAAYCEVLDMRLPTEAEWEYAARGPDGLLFPWGNEFDGTITNFCDANCAGDYADNRFDDRYQETAPVDTYPDGISWVGAYNLGGNVWEWTDSLSRDYPYDPDVEANDSADSDSDRIVRGGSWDNPNDLIRAAIRRGVPANIPSPLIGFRCARSYESPDAIPLDQPTPTAAPESAEDPAISLAFAGVDTNSDWTPYIQEFDGMEMALVPAGCFMMGSNENSNEQPVHEVCFEEPFWIDVYEVTNGQYGTVNVDRPKDTPRDSLTWFEIVDYCESRGARLPSEAEWEYAARGPDGLVYPWGNEFIADNAICQVNADWHMWDVGSKPGGVSWVGAYDMSGNAWEWVNDWYGRYYYVDSPRINPQGPDSGEERVLRGGAYGGQLDWLRSAFRSAGQPGTASYFAAFRCARSYGD